MKLQCFSHIVKSMDAKSMDVKTESNTELAMYVGFRMLILESVIFVT